MEENINDSYMKKSVDLIDEYTIVKRFFIRAKTNSGDCGKQYFTVAKHNVNGPLLFIRKLVYCGEIDQKNGFRLLKWYKGKGLYEKTFSINFSTLSSVISVINKINV